VAADELDVPLGKSSKFRKIELPFKAPQLLAGVLGLSVIVIGLWTAFGDDPYGGEPVAIVPTKAPTSANSRDTTVAAALQGGAPQQPRPAPHRRRR
jgi:hypothetical protein